MAPTASDSAPVEFHFDPMGRTEDLRRYSPGGYHPVVVGNTFDQDMTLPDNQRRYRILHKLGYGSYATIWLARDQASNAFVALKVTTAESSRAEMREARMLRQLAGAAEGPSTHILTLCDQFSVQGPNGLHHILATEVVVPLLTVLRPETSPRWRKSAARALASGVAHMHASGIKHGDLHLGNLGCAFPELAQQSEDDVMQDLDPYDITVVLPCNPEEQTPSLPAYVLSACNLGEYCRRIRLPERDPDIRILDFGNARFADDPASDIQCAEEACAPEVAFARVALHESKPAWGPPSDIWALGAAIYEIVSGSSLFYGVGIGEGLLDRMVALTGSVPVRWQTFWQSRHARRDIGHSSDSSHEAVDREWARRRDRLREKCADDADVDRLVALLRRILVLEPEKRPTIDEVVQDPWFQVGDNIAAPAA
ncbi:hypothetical protein BN946_scf184851.g58 [Trametes cinnabarina]|uniref:Protein kinase domain-containing protein n=1 Tax=Pycnoporus cinnabarinus TaxID=5643 RepID=A0A060S5P0_PYCCI|nr:hypothetical protein BN946_scf184851.g58 [Trametes cinnabarina]